MKFPLGELLSIVLGVFFSGVLMSGFETLLNYYDIKIARLYKAVQPPEPRSEIGKILYVILGYVWAIVGLGLWIFFGTTILTWGNVAYNYYIDSDIMNCIYTFLLNVFACFYMTLTTKDLPTKRGRW